MTDTKASPQMNSSDMPTRFQLKRTPGWRMTEGGVSVARPHRFGNPYVTLPKGPYTPDEAVTLLRDLIDKHPEGSDLYPSVAEIRERLAGRPLGCFCKLDQPCHADVLIDVANR